MDGPILQPDAIVLAPKSKLPHECLAKTEHSTGLAAQVWPRPFPPHRFPIPPESVALEGGSPASPSGAEQPPDGLGAGPRVEAISSFPRIFAPEQAFWVSSPRGGSEEFVRFFSGLHTQQLPFLGVCPHFLFLHRVHVRSFPFFSTPCEKKCLPLKIKNASFLFLFP